MPQPPEGHGLVRVVAERRPGRPRDRRGRGVRGVLWLPGPLSPRAAELLPTRRDEFDELVLSLVDRLSARLGHDLDDVVFGTEDVPPVSDDWTEPVPLGSHVRGTSDLPARVVLFRRPIDARAKTRPERVLLMHAQLVEQVSALLGRDPDDLGGLDE